MARRPHVDEAPEQLRLWAVALVVGVVSGYAAIGFRLAIAAAQTLLYGADDRSIHSAAARLDPLLVIAIPIMGGLVVGLLLRHFSDRRRVEGVADVIHAAALRDGRVSRREGAVSALASLVTLSTGGSSGREGPVVHLAATLASWIEERLGLHGVTARDVLGAAVAAAVSASFNAPIAGALFALEVVLRHYAVHAFGPITLASVAGAVVSRLHMGDVTEFMLPPPTMSFYVELPAFALLGAVCGLAAVALMRGIFLAERLGDVAQARLGLGVVQRPMAAGAILGLLAVGFPHVIGVGYETTSRALTGGFGLGAAIVLAVVKGLAVAVTFAGRMGGGVFSPALMLGALTGVAFGEIAIAAAPLAQGAEGLYAIAGMGAVAAAVLGAPISTTLIVFELTGDYQTAIAVMIAVSTSTVLARRMVRKSFFLAQLERAGVALAAGPMRYLPQTVPVAGLTRPQGADDGVSESAAQALIDQGACLTCEDTLAIALPMFDSLRRPWLPVVEARGDAPPELVGALFHVDALKAINRALVDAHHEEHG